MAIQQVFWVSVLNASLFFLFRLMGPSTALVYNGINSTIDGIRGEHDLVGSMAAGALTGALYKSTGTCQRSVPACFDELTFRLCSAGVRPALVAATFMSGMAGVWSYVKRAV